MDNFKDALAEAGRKVASRHNGGGVPTGDLLNHEERHGANSDANVALTIETRQAVRDYERGEAKLGAVVAANIIRLSGNGSLPKSGRKAAKVLGFRADNGAARWLMVAKAALNGAAPIVTPLKRDGQIMRPVRYASWPEAVQHEGITATAAAAKAVMSKTSATPTHRAAFAKAVHQRVAALHRLMPFGGVADVMLALADGRLYSQEDVAALYTGPTPDLPMERGQTWDDVLATLVESADVPADTDDDNA